eukprot:TRINITY_DN22014_c0_g1_i8.p1 TRINITY_DN22014_c0_g1~~TRINITY_DN22014_c0_g1_i8.p1  ORF type:complete len:120 (-),score=2.31 TRINITY_DN22014_c0_g1_i8:176-535(-)
MPKVDQQDETVFVGVVLCRVPERRVQDENAIVYPFSRLVCDIDLAVLRDTEAEVRSEEAIATIGVRCNPAIQWTPIETNYMKQTGQCRRQVSAPTSVCRVCKHRGCAVKTKKACRGKAD